MTAYVTPHPGEYLRDELRERGLTGRAFAKIIGRPEQVVCEIMTGRKGITVATAFQFADALGTTPEVWLNLQTMWRCSEYRRLHPEATA